MDQQLMNLIQAKLLMTDSKPGSDDNGYGIFQNIILLQLLNWGKTFIPSVVTAIYNKYIKNYVSKQQQKLITTTKSKVNLVKYYTNASSNNEHNKVDGTMYYINNLINLSSLTYNGSYYYFDFYTSIDIEKYIQFKLVSVELNKDKCDIERIEFELSSNTKDIQYIRNFIDNCHEKYDDIRKNKLGNDLYYFDTHLNEFSNNNNVLEFKKNKFYTNKNMNNIFFKSKKELDKRLDVFMNNPEWYKNNGIPLTIGLLLHGTPGCGKTSTIKAIANKTKRHIVNINMAILKNNKQLKQLFYSEYLWVKNEQTNNMEQIYVPIYKRLYIFEDIDCMNNNVVLKRELINDPTNNDLIKQIDNNINVNVPNDFLEFNNYSNSNYSELNNNKKNKNKEDDFLKPMDTNINNKKENDPITLSSLLNILDGTLETPGRIIIMTTNHPEVIDEALIRPGRIDMKIEFTLSSKEMIIDMYENFYNEKFPESKKDCIKEDILTPAEVIQIFFRNINNPKNSMKELINF